MPRHFSLLDLVTARRPAKASRSRWHRAWFQAISAGTFCLCGCVTAPHLPDHPPPASSSAGSPAPVITNPRTNDTTANRSGFSVLPPSSEQAVRRWLSRNPVMATESRRRAEPARLLDSSEWRLSSHGLAASEDSGPPAPGSSGQGAPPPVKHQSVFSKDYWKLVGVDIQESAVAPMRWDRADWLTFGGVAAGIGLTFAFDDEIQKAVQRNRNPTVNDAFTAIEPLGESYAAAILGGFYLGGGLFHDERATSVGLEGLSASLIASVLVDQPLKYGVGRSRPEKGNGPRNFAPFSGASSFPSGHATEAFAVATVISENYDALWVKVAAYGLASGVGYARVNGNHHWASDVVAGAAIGTFIGHVVVHVHQQDRGVALSPIVNSNFKGAMLSWSF